jgi:hypothetical protein
MRLDGSSGETFGGFAEKTKLLRQRNFDGIVYETRSFLSSGYVIKKQLNLKQFD